MKRGTESIVRLGKSVEPADFSGINVLSTVILGKKESATKDFNGLFITDAVMLGKKISHAAVVTATVRGVSPLSLPSAVANSLSYVKAFGGTEQRNIPAEYTQVNYVTNVVQASINTGIILDSTKTYEFELETSGVTDYWYILQARTGPNSTITGITGSATGNTILLGLPDGTNIRSSISRVFGNRYLVKGTLSGGQATLYVKDITNDIEDTVTGTYTQTPIDPAPVYLLGNAAGQLCQINCNIYMARIKEDGVTIMDYIPCRERTVAGFYDRVTGSFMTTDPTTSLSADGNTVPTPDTPMDIVSNNGVLKARHQSGLPLGYTQLEYIESTGTRYIDTGITLGGGTNYKNTDIKLEYDAVINQGTRWQVSGTLGSAGIFIGVNPGNNIAYNAGQTPDIISGVTNPYVRCLWINDAPNGRVTVKNMITGVNILDATYTPAIKTNLINILLFNYSVSDGSASNNYMYGKMYGAKIYNNGTLIRNFVPAKDAGGVVGMYDTVSGTFFTNQGTGEFIAGDPVNDPVEIYTDGLQETIAIKDDQSATVSSAVAEMLLKVGDYQDEQEIISGVVTRNVGVKVLDGTEDIYNSSAGYWGIESSYFPGIKMQSPMVWSNCWTQGAYISPTGAYCSIAGLIYFAFNKGSLPNASTEEDVKQWIADQYAAGTPVIVVYPLATATTESVTGQTLQVADGDNVLEITQASMTGLELEAQYQKRT